MEGKISPADDTDVINFELALADVGQVEKRLARLNKGARKTPEEKAKEALEKETLEIISDVLESGQPARAADLTEDQKDSVKHLQLLTMKPLVYAANVAEDELAAPDDNVHVGVRTASSRTTFSHVQFWSPSHPSIVFVMCRPCVRLQRTMVVMS